MTDGKDVLRFPADQFTLESKTVEYSGQTHTVSFRQYRHIPYVASPVDPEYQSLDVLVPVSVDGVPVDASGAPILFNITVGGYLSASNLNEHRGMPPRPAHLPPRRGESPHKAIVGMRTRRLEMALVCGYVVVTPGARGREIRAADGSYPGKAPAAIVDLKAAVRYLRHNRGHMPGNPDWIVTSGCSAGGALSALLGTSGNSDLYAPWLARIGAADTEDHVFASVCYSPITDLDHADLSYEWFFGPQEALHGPVDPEISQALAALHAPYQDSLGLTGRDGFGALTTDRLEDYLQQQYLRPAAAEFLTALGEAERTAYLAEHPWVHWDGQTAHFTLADLALEVRRGKRAPAFDDFAMVSPEVSLFGDAQTDVRHFTDFSLQHALNDPTARVGADLAKIVRMMNAMQFAREGVARHAHHWWLRTGTHDHGISPSVMVNLGACLENHGHDVSTAFFWNGGHCADADPEGMIAWIARITGYTATASR